jgi:hypothetical protein
LLLLLLLLFSQTQTDQLSRAFRFRSNFVEVLSVHRERVDAVKRHRPKARFRFALLIFKIFFRFLRGSKRWSRGHDVFSFFLSFSLNPVWFAIESVSLRARARVCSATGDSKRVLALFVCSIHF